MGKIMHAIGGRGRSRYAYVYDGRVRTDEQYALTNNFAT